MALGYDLRGMDIPLKMELEYHFRYHFDIESRRIKRNPSNDILYDASVKSGHTFQVNFLVPWAINPKFDLLVGGGIGVIRQMTEIIRVDIESQVSEPREMTNYNLTWNLALGFDWRFGESWSAEAMYRYVDLGEIETGTFSTGDSVTYQTIFSHELLLGLAYHF